MLDFSKDKVDYVVPVAQAMPDKAPTDSMKDQIRNDGDVGKMRESSYSYYDVKCDW